MDCQAVFPQWAGVSFGVLLCLVCAGKHRSLGVQTSVVKSLVMDAWSIHETRAMAIGGNAKWTAVCAGARIVDFTMVDKYSSNVARVYRNQVALLAATKELLEEECAEFTATSFLALVATTTLSPRDHAILARRMENVVLPLAVRSKALLNSEDDAHSTSVECTTCCIFVSLDQLDSHSKTCTVVSTSVGLANRFCMVMCAWLSKLHSCCCCLSVCFYHAIISTQLSGDRMSERSELLVSR